MSLKFYQANSPQPSIRLLSFHQLHFTNPDDQMDSKTQTGTNETLKFTRIGIFYTSIPKIIEKLAWWDLCKKTQLGDMHLCTTFLVHG